MAAEIKLSKEQLNRCLNRYKGMYFLADKAPIASITLNKILRLGLVEVGLIHGDDIYYIPTERAYEQMGVKDKYQLVSSSYNMMIVTHERLNGIEDSPARARLEALENHYRKLAGATTK